MSLTCKILASFLLIPIFSTKGAAPPATEVHGALNHDINLNIPDFHKVSKTIEDIKWKKDQTRIARYYKDEIREPLKETYELFRNGTLKIKYLQRSDSGIYTVDMYDKQGQNVVTKTFDLRIQEGVSKPLISWSCTNTTLTCEVTYGTDPNLTLSLNEREISVGQQTIKYKWSGKERGLFKCTAANKVSKKDSEQISMTDINCSDKGPSIYLIISICGGGVTFFLIVALLILFVSKRRQQRRRRNDEELEIRARRITSEERSQKLHHVPASAPPNSAASQPPPPPGHRPHAHGHRPAAPGHRAQHQHQQRRPLPPLGTQVHQQKGPPLPRPRVQPKPPRGATENS